MPNEEKRPLGLGLVLHGDPEKVWSLQAEDFGKLRAALGDSLLGAPIAEALGLPREAARDIAAAALRARLEAHHSGD